MRYALTFFSLLLIFFTGLVCVLLCIFVVKLYLPGTDIVEVPFTLNRVYIVKVKLSDWKGANALDVNNCFQQYLAYQKKAGWLYLPEKRLGRLLFFQRNNITKSMVFPKFIGLKWY